MNKTLMGIEDSPKMTKSDSHHDRGHIRDPESDAFVSRLRDVIGEKKQTWFASECGLGESTLRNILAGAWPRTDILVRLAAVGGVTVDWLATGHPPKTRAEVRPKAESALDTWKEAVQAVHDWQIRRKQMLPADKFMQTVELIADLAGEGGKDAVRPLAERVLRLVV